MRVNDMDIPRENERIAKELVGGVRRDGRRLEKGNKVANMEASHVK